jgi:hypothetical protein
MKSIGLMFAGSLLTLFALYWGHVPKEETYEAGFQKGWSMALDTDGPSDDLEFACAALWFGRDGPIFYKMRKEYEQRTNLK